MRTEEWKKIRTWLARCCPTFPAKTTQQGRLVLNKPHSMRHGATSALLADGATPAVVQKQLRHSDAHITLGIYGHVVGNQQRDAVENRSARIEAFAVN